MHQGTQTNFKKDKNKLPKQSQNHNLRRLAKEIKIYKTIKKRNTKLAKSRDINQQEDVQYITTKTHKSVKPAPNNK